MAGSIDSTADTGQELAFAYRPVPLDKRINRMPLTMAWWSVCSAMFYLFVSASLALEAREQKALGSSHDYLEGVAAFMAKRAPVSLTAESEADS